MSVLNQRLHIQKTGGTEQTALIYTSLSECSEPNLKVNIGGVNGYIKLGNPNNSNATLGRVHLNNDNNDYAILSQAVESDFPEEWGRFLTIKFSMTRSVNRREYAYAWCLHFENGELPIIVGYKDTKVSFNKKYFHATIHRNYDSASYIGTWNTILPSFVTENKEISAWTIYDQETGAQLNADNMPKSTMTAWGWPNTSARTNDFSFTATAQKLKIYKKGKLFKTFTLWEG